MRHWLEGFASRFLRIRTKRQVFVGTAFIAIVAILAPALIILLAAPILTEAPASLINFMLAMRVVIGLFVIMPLGFFVLHLIRLQGLTMEEAQNASRFDGLTGAMTRGYFFERARQELPRGGGLMMVDADCFKAINDTFGHAVGDEALKLMVQVMRHVTGPDALIGRLGGEEFAVLLPGAQGRQSQATGEALCDALREAGRMVAGLPVGLTLSIGAVCVEAEGSLEQGLRRADLLLYEAKKAGRDQLVMQRPQDPVADLCHMAASMRRSLPEVAQRTA